MKKLFMWIAIAMVAVIVLSTFSHLFEPFKDNSGDPSSTVATTVEPIVSYQDGLFYYLDSSDNLVAVKYYELDDLPNETRGFFIFNDTACFSVLQNYSSEFGTHVFEDGLPSYGSYEYCRKYTTDMKELTSIDEDDMYNNFLPEICLIVYATNYNLDPLGDHKDLCENVDVSLSHHDPAEIEGPSAG